MRFRRRDFFKVGAAGVVSALASDSSPAAAHVPDMEQWVPRGGGLAIKIRGLCLLDSRSMPNTMIVRMVSGEKVGIDPHLARLRVETTALDKDATSLDPTSVENAGTSREIYFYDLKGRTVSVLDDSATPDLDLDPDAPPATQHQPIFGNWRSMKWIPNLAELTEASVVNAPADAFVCNIPLKHGRLHGDVPKSRIGPLAIWTFKKPAGMGGAVLTQQSYSDTALYTRPLMGRTPVIKIDYMGTSGRVVLLRGASGQVVFENISTVVPPPGSITLGHFDVFYGLVNKMFIPNYTVVPPTLPPCPNCETDPIYCPPSWI